MDDRRVLVLTDRFPPQTGTRATMASVLAREAADLGCEVTVLIPALPWGQSVPGGAPMVPHPRIRVRRSALWGLMNWLAAGHRPRPGLWARVCRSLEILALFWAALWSGKPDALLLVRGVPHGNLGLALARIWGCGVFLQLTGDEIFPGRWGTRTLNLFRTALDGADRVHSPTVLFGEALRRLHPGAAGKIQPSAPWIDIEAWNRVQEPERRGEVRQDLGLGPEEFVLVTMTRLIPWKGVDTLILALPELLAEGLPVRLLVIGDGPQRQDLEDSARDLGLAGSPDRPAVVQFLGELPDPCEVIQACDGFVLAVRTVGETAQAEGSALAPLEVALAGVPLILGNSGAMMEHFTDGETALLVKPASDPRAYGQAISRLYRDRNLGSKLSQQARATMSPVLRDEDQSRRVEQLLDAIRKNRSLIPEENQD